MKYGNFKGLGLALSMLACTFLQPAIAAEVEVEPGHLTLSRAISAAEAGDVLVLQDGIYYMSEEDTQVIDKSLTIRALNAQAAPKLIYDKLWNFKVEVRGADTDFVMQGVTVIDGYFDVRGEVKSVAFLENNLTDSNLHVYPEYDPDGNLLHLDKLVVVGNRFVRGYIDLAAEDLFLFAGNHSSFSSFRASSSLSLSEQHVLGNSFVLDYNTQFHVGDTSGTHSRVIGNFINRLVSDDSNSASQVGLSPIYLYGNGVFSNNTVLAGGNTYQAPGTPSSITLAQFYGSFDVKNNVFHVEPIALQDRERISIDVRSGDAHFSNNIFVNLPNDVAFSGLDRANGTTLENNLCFSELDGVPCIEHAGVTVVDDLKLDSQFRPLAGSPAINAGIDDVFYRDVDGTRSDIGIEGGPLPKSQFDAQRSASESAPYLYPLFEANASLSNNGELNVKAIAISKLR
ncbi:hypothetical protein [Vibrio sp. 10N]|uniref:hypothetical protein n=1 Tax=Vibrio sp. 10N TaxID=3058938 RepID=UPI002813EA03|nr:hypothetical protein VB10N_29100 [Vibrio sp. 10N]